MKRLKKTLALLAAALFCVLPLLSPINAQAAEPITYYLKYLPEKSSWAYQQLTAWDYNDNYGDISYVVMAIKDGDSLVIDGDVPFDLELNVQLANLTVLNASTFIFNTKGIDELYLHDGITIINCDVKNAYVYNESVCNFNKNVTNLNILGVADINATVAVIGTVNHVKGADNYKTYYEAYNFKPETLYIEKGSLRTEAANYSTTPSTTTTTPSTTPSAPSAGEYDDVPKTGDSYLALMLVGAAAVCLFGSYRLKRS